MEQYKKLQMNKRSIKEKYPTKISIKSKNKSYSNKVSNDLYNISVYQLLNNKSNAEKISSIKKNNIQPVNFYISSINKVYNNTDRSVNINHQNPLYRLNNDKNTSCNQKNKIFTINNNINSTYIEHNSQYINDKINNNSKNNNILNNKMNFDTELFLKNKNNFSPNRTIGDIHLNQFYLNKNFFQSMRSHSGENKKRYYIKKFLNSMRSGKISNIPLNKKQSSKNHNINNVKNKNIVNDLNNRINSINSYQLKNKNRLYGKEKTSKKNKIKINDNQSIEIENIYQIKNREYIPFINRNPKENYKKLNNTENINIQAHHKNNDNNNYSNNKYKKFSNKKKMSLIPNCIQESNNDKHSLNSNMKKKILKYCTSEVNNFKVSKNINNSNKGSFKTLQNEQYLALRANNKNILNSTNKTINNNFDTNEIFIKNQSIHKISNIKRQISPMIYKKRNAMSPLSNNKLLSSLLPKNEEKIDALGKIKTIMITNTSSPSMKQKNITRISIKEYNNNIPKNTKINLNQLYKSNSCYKINIIPSIYKTSSSEKNIHMSKGNENSLLMADKSQRLLAHKNEANGIRSSNSKNEKFEINKKFIIKKNSSICQGGENYPNEEKKINQDNLFKTKFEEINISFYGVCDGHGENGHLVSEFIKINLPLIMYKEIKSLFYLINNDECQSKDKIKAYFSEICKQSFDITNKKLISNKNIDSSLSGSTCVSLLFYEDLIISANLGDSRAIIGKLKNSKWSYELLSRDHKPTEIDEALRIKYKNGEIHPFVSENGEFNGPERIWISGQGIPGLAMTRSFGDIVGSTVGVLSEPEIKCFNYEKSDKFIVIGSDGLWEYLSCQEVVNIVGEFYKTNNLNSDAAVMKLYQISRKKWLEIQGCIDDISIIILFLE